MQKDINVIIDVEEKEAELLIGLLELLAKEWYIARHIRQERLAKITKLAEDKKPKPEGDDETAPDVAASSASN